MRSVKKVIPAILFILALTLPASAQVENNGFETGDFTGWTADSNWVVVDNSCGYYSGWHGKYWAWSGGKGEPAMGKLKSKAFVLNKDRVRVMLAGWNSVLGTGQPRKWNYITLNLPDGAEVDRVYAPNSVAFTPVYLDGSTCKGKSVYIEAVDDADQAGFSMLCIDDVDTVDVPAYMTKPALPLPVFDARKYIRLKDENYLIEISRANGVIARILDKKSGLDLIREPRLAENYKFSLPIPGKEPWETLEANYVMCKNQRLSSFDIAEKKVTLNWNKPLKSTLGGKVNASAMMTIELADGGILLSMRVDNKTPYQIGEAYFPMIGGIQGFGKTVGQLKGTQFIRPVSNGATGSDIFRLFVNYSPFGDQGPEQYFSYPGGITEPWVELYEPKLNRSAYIGACDPTDRARVIHLELIPGISGVPREDGNWPRSEELKGLPVGVTLSFVEFANHPAGKAFEPSPVLIRFHDGDWSEGQKIYREWKDFKRQ